MIHDPIIILRPDTVYIDPLARVDSWVKIEGAFGDGHTVTIGPYVHIASYCHLNIGGGQLIMRRGSALGSGCRVVTGSNVHGYGISCSAIDPTAKFRRSQVIIDEDAVAFVGAIILPGVTLGRNSVVAAGAVVTCDVPPYEVWGGVPARKIGEIHPPTAADSDASLSRWVQATIDFTDGSGQ